MKTFGLTGGIAVGKTTVAKLFRERGVPVLDLDDISREVTSPGEPGLAQIVKHFGDVFLLSNGLLDRRRLGFEVFGKPYALAALEEIVGPLILARLDQQLAAMHDPLVGVDGALLVEKGLADRFRPLVVVTTTPEVQLQRLMARNQLSEPAARARVDAQMSLAEKVRHADYVIDTTCAPEDLPARVAEVIASLKG